MEYAIPGMYQDNLDLGLLQDTKLTKHIYTRDYSGYKVVAMEAPSAHSDGVAVFLGRWVTSM